MESTIDAILESGDDDEFSDYEDDDIPMPAAPPEDGEIVLPPSGLPLGSDLCFVDNDLDSAIRNAKRTPITRKKKKRSRLKKSKDGLNKKTVLAICGKLKEPKIFLVEAAIKRLGVDVVKELVKEVQTIEAHGGQMTADGKRRRTPGGVLWNVLRSRYSVEYKAIMAAGKDAEKQQKRKLEQDSMDIDNQPAKKRRRTSTVRNESLASQIKKNGTVNWPSENKQLDTIESKLDPENSQWHKHAVSAWVESVKLKKKEPNSKEEARDNNDVALQKEFPKRKMASLAERLRAPIVYDDLVD